MNLHRWQLAKWLGVGVVALAAILPGSPPVRPAHADTGLWSDGWPACNWWGSTWFSTATLGWARTEGPASCTDHVALRLQWYNTSSATWVDTLLQYSASGVPWKQYGGSPTNHVIGTHQIYVIGWGYSNIHQTQE